MGKQSVAGQVTVFISLIMICVFALFCVMLESARTAGARWYLQMAASSAMDSVFSQYHRQLWDSYRLLFAEYPQDSQLEQEFADFLQPYLESNSWYPMELSGVTAEDVIRAGDGQGRYLEQEILDYMAYGVWKLDFDEDTAAGLWDSVKEAAAVTDMAGNYRGHAKEALQLEKSLEAISESLNKQKELQQAGLRELRQYDGPGFRREAQKLVRELERIPGLVDTYAKRADQLAEGLAESRQGFEARSGDYTDAVRAALEQEIQEYESYAAEDGARRKEIEALREISNGLVSSVESLIEEAKEVEREIDEWESDDEDDEGPDLASLWSPVTRKFSRLEIASLSFSHGVKDKEKEGWLEKVEGMYQAGLLELVVPEGTDISGQTAVLTDAPSDDVSEGDRTIGFLDHLLVDEYCGMYFRDFCKGIPDGETGSYAGPENTVLQYEVEYLLGGRPSDRDNLSYVVHQLLAVREGLNLVHLMTDGEKRAEARNLAAAITGIAAATPLLLVTMFFILSVWALGESLMDIKGLLAGKKVPLIKGKEDWTLSLDQLLAFGRDGSAEGGGGEQGLSYLSWLKILLFVEDITRQEFRMMDLIQMNLMQEQTSFRMKHGVYQVRIRGELCGQHRFFSLFPVENLAGRREGSYPMEITVERAYQ